MADNNLARTRNDIPDIFAEDDPLAELARIVGYDERLVPTPQAPVPPAISAPRREPAFNLEDELLREFERYDAPRLDAANDASTTEPVSVSADQRAADVVVPAPSVPEAPLPHVAEDEAAPVEHYLAQEAPLQAWDLPASVQPVAPEAVAEAWPLQAERAPAYLPDTSSHANDVREPVSAPGALTVEAAPVEPGFDPFAQADELHAGLSAPSFPDVFEPLASQPDPVAHLPEEPAPVAQSYGFDLADELESSITPEPAPAVVAPAEPKRSSAYVPGFRMPLANFNINSRPSVAATPAVAPAPDVSHQPQALREERAEPAPVAMESLDWDFVPPTPTGASEPWSAQAAESALRADETAAPVPVASEPAAPMVATPVAPAVAPIAEKPVQEAASSRFSALDDLIYDVGRFPVGQPSQVNRPAPSVAPVPAPVVPSAAPAQMVEPAVARVEPVLAAAPVQAKPDVEAAFDPFTDDEFELALDDLELDLADVVVAENTRLAAEPVRMAAPAVSQPAPVAAAAAPIIASPAPYPVAPAAPDLAQPVVQQVDETPELEPDLPFDPALIAESEERPEAIADLDVPTLPAEEPEHEPAYRPEYDIDIDAELATLLVAATPDAAPEPVRPVAASAGDGKAQEPRPVYADLDEFERALEEDFRRSLATPLPPSEAYPDVSRYSDASSDGEGRGASRNWVLPVAVVGALAVLGGGAYAWLGTGVSGIVSGEPVIIAADKDPIKVAPENPGGKTVPNQDKAVYDRVAGAAPEAPKQQTLISSNEQPVDVVQKTLMPDNLPMDGEDDVAPTDVGQTEDPRLLPQQDQQAAAGTQQDPVTVTPRKVKTMIVRPDGKLVEQEVAAPAPALAAPSQKMPAASSKSVDVAALPAQDDVAAIASASAPASGIVPVSAPVEPARPAQTAAPVAVEQPAVSQPAARAPVPAMRPAQQPVNVVAAVTDQGNVRPAQAPAAAAGTQQVASLGDGGYVIQIASLPTQADAQKSYQNLSAKFGSVIGGRGVDIKAAEIAGKGTFYRVRIPAGSKTDAVSLCERYRAVGGTCLVAK